MEKVFAVIGVAAVFLVAYELVAFSHTINSRQAITDMPQMGASFLIEEIPCHCGEIVLEGYDVQKYDVKPYFDNSNVATV
jgi:hypothetical protein